MLQKPSTRKKARRYAVQGIYQWHMSGGAINDIECQFLETINQKKVDVPYFREILVNTLGSIRELDDSLALFVDRPINEINPVELAILRLACYELKSRLDIPFKVVINEALELTKTFGASEAHRLVNRVLDQVAKKLRPTEAR